MSPRCGGDMKNMKSIAELVQAVASLLWPILVLFVVLLFREQIREVLSQFKRVRSGRIFGQEFVFEARLSESNTSITLNKYLYRNGVFIAERARDLNMLLREQGDSRDVLLILDGAEAEPTRKKLIDYAKTKGVNFD